MMEGFVSAIVAALLNKLICLRKVLNHTVPLTEILQGRVPGVKNDKKKWGYLLSFED